MSSKTHKKTTEVRIWFCDICGEECENRSCRACGRTICRSCSTYDDRDHGDYPDRFCVACWGHGTPAREKIKQVEQAYDDWMSDREEAWRDAAKKASEAQMNENRT